MVGQCNRFCSKLLVLFTDLIVDYLGAGLRSAGAGARMTSEGGERHWANQRQAPRSFSAPC